LRELYPYLGELTKRDRRITWCAKIILALLASLK